MAKTQKPNEEEKIVKENVQKRFKNMFSGENEPPSNMSLKEVEALQARVAELESQLSNQPGTPLDNKAAISTVTPSGQYLSKAPDKDHPDEQHTPVISAMLEKRVGLWVTGIMSTVGLLFFGVGLYILFIVQGGVPELSDKVLTPTTLVIFIVNLIGFLLIRRDQTVPGLWVAYLMNVMLPPLALVLMMENMYIVMGMFLAIFSLIFITLVMPKASRLQAAILAVVTALVITGIEVWHPGFRDTTNRIQNVTSVISGAAALGIIVLFLVIRQLWSSRIGPGGHVRRRSLATVLTIIFFTMSIVLLLINGLVSIAGNYLSYRTSLSTQQLLVAREASQTVANSIQEKISVLETAVDFGNPITASASTRQGILESLLGLQPSFRQLALLSTTGRQVTVISRQSSSLSQQFASQLTGDLLAQTQAGQGYISPVYIDELTSEPLVIIAVPAQNVFGDFQGVLAAELNLKFMWDLVDQLEIGETGYAYVVDDHGTLIAFEDTARVLRGENVQQIPEVKVFVQNPSGVSDNTPGLITYTGLLGETVVGSYVPLGTPQWAVVIELPTTEAYQPIVRTFLTSGFTILFFALLMGLAGSILARRLSAPLIELSNIAIEVSGGNLGVQQASVTGPFEIAQLATTFNTMTDQLRELVAGLEQRVADRTHDLELAAEVGRTVTGKVTHVAEMLTEAVEVIRARFDLYYTQIYLTDPASERLILRAGTGDVGSLLLQRGHNLVVNSASLNGRAVLEKRAQIVADTTENPTFLSNPLLPNTRSEMSIPLIVEGNVVGVLDMQSERPGALSESNLPAFEALAGQLAVAIRNAVLFMEVQEARSEVESQMVRFTERGWGNFLNAIDQEHKIGFAFSDNKINRLQPETLSTPARADNINMPIMVTGTKVGEIQLPAHLKSSDLELVSAVSEQLAQHVENLRLLAQAENFRKEAEEAVRRLTHEGWEGYLSSSSQLKTGYVYDLNQVQPLSENNNPVADQALKRPLVVRDEPIGELKLDLPESSETANEILSAVAQQLSGHLENLRLSELNERHAQREQTLRQITSALRSSTNPATIMRTAVRELGTTLGRKAVIQMVTPEQAAQGTENETDSPANQS